jgi:glycerol kinase
VGSERLVSVRTLVLDIGTSSVRATIVRADGSTEHELVDALLPTSPADGLVEFDATRLASTTLALAQAVIDVGGPVDGVAITNQRASTIVWDRSTGEPVGPGLGWQDLRTIGACFAARAHGLRVAPNQTATKAQWLLDQTDPDRRRNLCVGTVDSYIAWIVSGGDAFVTDATNAGVTGLADAAIMDWDASACAALGIARESLPRIVDSAGELGIASQLRGAPPIVAMLGDQQASLAGQGCVAPGQAKITFGTGGMLDVNLGERVPRTGERHEHGSFPIVAWRIAGVTTWGIEAIMLAAGTNIEWLRDGLGLIESAADSHQVAEQCVDSGGVTFVPAPVGLGTPAWDYGARSTFLGVTRGTTAAQMVRAVLEGVAQRGADLVDAATADAGVAIESLRIDGGMSDNPTFVGALADATGLVVEVAPVREATTRGAGLVGALALGAHRTLADVGATFEPRIRVEPTGQVDRDRWPAAVARARHWLPTLSTIDF